MSRIEMKRRLYLKTVISKFFEDYQFEPIDERTAAVLRSRIESKPNHNGEFEVRLTNGTLLVLHLGAEICNFGN